MKIKTYYDLTKPGIIRGNLITALAGFFLASKGHILPHVFFGVILGTIFLIACGCVLNNYLDRHIDKKMERTKNRALVLGIIKTKSALIYASILFVLGSGSLLVLTNFLTYTIGLIGLITYVGIYGYTKRRTIYGTVIGAISGAIPPVVGYCAVTAHITSAAIILFFILVSWQMTHFYAISIYRSKEYASAKIPLLPLVKGIYMTKIQMILYGASFVFWTAMLTRFGYSSEVYLIVILVCGFYWFVTTVRGLNTKNDNAWAKKVFLQSLIIITVWSLSVSIDSFFH
ncbi:MAG: heme o synthase [Candidatus Saccharimonadales bacterium]